MSFAIIGWSAVLALAILWPGRIVGPLDGAPLDAPLEAVVVALVLPLIWLLHPRFLRTWFARSLIVALLAWKVATASFLTQGGWCGEFVASYPASDTYRLERSWDVRTYWTPSPPACSAIVSRRFETLADFPAWIINVPFDDDLIVSGGRIDVPTEPAKPPDGVFQMLLSGVLRPRRAGTLSFEMGSDVRFDGSIDGQPLPAPRGGIVTSSIGPGEHSVAVQLSLAGARWRFVPRWDGHDLFAAVPTGVDSATSLDRAVDGWGQYVTPVLVLLLLATWTGAAIRQLRFNRGTAVWIATSTAAALALGANPSTTLVRPGVVMLIGAVAVHAPPRLRNWRGALVLLGLPWICLFAIRSIRQVGRFTIYNLGDDWGTFQGFAYKIFMHGYWLQGGEHKPGHPPGVFWYQPLYRWIAGVLHLVFGDSSVGELYLDVAGTLIVALVSFEIVRGFAGFRPGVAAGALTLATVTIGPNWYLIGRGLSEICASAWIGLAALALMRARGGDVRWAALAGIFGVLAFYTRLNHLPVLLALVALALPDDVTADGLWHWRAVWSRAPARVAVWYLACATIGVCAFAWRTSFYAGHLTLFGGQNEHLSTGLGLTAASFWSPSVWGRAAESVLMIVTVQDPPRFDVRSLLVVTGVLASFLAIMRAPVVRRLPLGPVIVCLGSLVGGLVARGAAYPGRFSIHLIPFAVAVSLCTIALAAGRLCQPPHRERISDLPW